MKLSDGEKLILLMLSDIYAHLEIDPETGFDPEFIKSAVHNDHIWGLTWQYPGIPWDMKDTPPAVGEVVNILEMWDVVEGAYEKLSREDQHRVKTGAGRSHEPKFPGFDGNNEAKHYSIALFLTRDLHKFSRFRDRDLNSHAPLLGAYERMYAVFEPMRPSITFGTMSGPQLIEVLKAMRHPSHQG